MSAAPPPETIVEHVRPVSLQPGDRIIKVGNFRHSANRLVVTEIRLGFLDLVAVYGTSTVDPTPHLIFRGLNPDLIIEVERTS